MRTLLAALCVAASSMIASAGGWGVRLSFDVTHPAGIDDGLNNGSGFTAAVEYQLPIKSGFYFEPSVGAFYNTMGIQPLDYGGSLYDGAIRNLGIKAPVNFGYSLGLAENLDLAFYTGPWLNINLSARANLEPNFEGPAPSKSTSLFGYGWRRVDAQWGFGLKVTYAKQYYMALSGGLGITPMAAFDDGHGHKDRLRRNTFSVILGYSF